MKEFGFTTSILSNTNRAISSTETNWTAIRPGSFFIFGDDNVFYQVGVVKELNIIKEFKIIAPNQISFSSNLCPLFLNYDSIELSFKQYEVDEVVGIFSAGTNYKQGDIICLSGGVPVKNLSENISKPATFQVTKVNSHGGIEDLIVTDPGQYIVAPNTTTVVVNTLGSGSNGGLNLLYKISDKRIVIDRVINNVIYHPESTILTLDYDLPENLTTGKLSLNKWEVLLTSNYIGESKLNSKYKVLRDFTPNLKLPVITKNTNNLDVLVNQGFQTIDCEFGKIKSALKNIGIDI